VTLAGEITGVEARPLGNTTNTCRVLAIQPLHPGLRYVTRQPHPGYWWRESYFGHGR
jgi:hypothetical protein